MNTIPSYTMPILSSMFYPQTNRKNRCIAKSSVFLGYYLIRYWYRIAGRMFFAPWLFNTATLTTTGTTLVGAYYSIFAIFAPFILFCSCLHGCKKFNRKLFSERVTNRFTATDVLYAIQAICISFLKTALIYYLIAIFSSPIVLIVVVLIAVNSVLRFQW